MPKSKSDNPSRAATSLKRVVIVRFSAIGEVAMTVPSVYSACRCYPDTRFIMVTRASMTSIFVNPPANLTIVGVDSKDAYKDISGGWRLATDLIARLRPDALVDLQDSLATKAMRLAFRLHGIPTSHINKGLTGKRHLTRKHNKVMLPLESSLSRYRNTFVRAGLPLVDMFDGLYGSGKAPAADYCAISSPRPEAEHWIGIAPFAKFDAKTYPIDMMERVVEGLALHSDIRIFLFGGDGHEKETLARWAAKHPRVTSLAGRHFGFDAELALLSHLDCILSMDSANMHLAALVSIPVVSVWGATHPYSGFKAWRQKDDLMIQLPLTCRPCSVFGDKPCYRGDHLCMSAIKPQVIIDKLYSLSEKTRF